MLRQQVSRTTFPRNIFFTGKGGVGKTSLACATAIQLADAGKQVLLISTDPASNLDEVLETSLGGEARGIPKVPGLFALNINPEEAARKYREKVIGPYRDAFPKAVWQNLEEQLSGACTTEIAAFEEFAALIGAKQSPHLYDHLIFDTAPTGHTLRLLKLPAAWDQYLNENSGTTSCLGPLAGLQSKHRLFTATVAALADVARSVIVLVARPDGPSLKEAERTGKELAVAGIENQQLIVNGLFRGLDGKDPIARAMETRTKKAMKTIPKFLGNLPRQTFPLLPVSLIGVDSLRCFFRNPEKPLLERIPTGPSKKYPFVSLGKLLDEITQNRQGVIMTMGKGGVGKTVLATAIAVELSQRGLPVHLATTDPAAHLDRNLSNHVPGLKVTHIDPATETTKYREEILDQARMTIDKKSLDLLEEDLRSPCTEEIAVFKAFASVIDEGKKGFVVLDTAPTGHTLLLLDAAEAYHREVNRTRQEVPEAVKDLQKRLRDPEYTRVLIVTLPEATPVHEAAFLQADLKRAGIHPRAWVVNQSLIPCRVSDPILVEKRTREHRFLKEAHSLSGGRLVLVPWMASESGKPSWFRSLLKT